MASVDLSQTHLKTAHVVAIIVAIVGAAIPCVGVYINLTWEVRDLKTKQDDLPTRKDLDSFKVEVESAATHTAGERAVFYIGHSKLECDPPPKRGGKMACTLQWPPPRED